MLHLQLQNGQFGSQMSSWSFFLVFLNNFLRNKSFHLPDSYERICLFQKNIYIYLQSTPWEPYSHLKCYVCHDHGIPWMFAWHMLIIPSDHNDLTQFQRASPGATICRLFHSLIAQSSRQIYCLPLELCKGLSSRDCRRPLKNAGNSHRLHRTTIHCS